MMPPGHVAVTWAVARLWPAKKLDYRLLAVGALLPDALDKPLAMWVFSEAKSSQLVGHALLPNLLLLGITALFWRRGWPYALACAGHLLVDRMWHHERTFWWPLFGWGNFREYKPMHSPETMLAVYADIIRLPQVWLPEVLAGVFFLWLARRHRWYRWANLRHFLKTGQLKKAF